MKNRIPCEIIRDLLPLYTDKQTRSDTSKIICGHLSHCPECARMYEEMNVPLTPAGADAPADALGKIRRKSRLEALAGVCITFFIILIVTLFKLFIFGSPEASYPSMVEVNSDMRTITVSGTVSDENKAYSHYKIEKQADACRLIVYSCLPSFIHSEETFSIDLTSQDVPLKIGERTVMPDGSIVYPMANALYDNVGFTDIADKIGLRKALGSFELQLLSTSSPYRWEIIFKETCSYSEATSKSALMVKYACAMLALSGTSKEIKWSFASDDGSTISSSLDRNQANSMLKNPIEGYASTPKAVQQLLDELGIL